MFLPFLMLVGTECDLLCGSMCFPDFNMCIFISARVNMGIRNRLEDQPSVGNFIACIGDAAPQFQITLLPFFSFRIYLIAIWVNDVLLTAT